MPTLSAGQAAATPRSSLVQFLNSILSTRGPNSLPYEEENKFYVRQHLLAMIKEFQGLQIKTATFTHNDGRASYLLQGTGTIPMYYKDVKYNIPITIWLVQAYPRVAPLVFVTPTRDMIIKPQHRCVDASGAVVTVPYLQEWVYRRSNLVELVQSLSIVFGEDPPLYSRPPSVATQTEQAAAQAAVTSRPMSQSSIHATNPLHSSAGQDPGSTSTSSPRQGSSAVQSPNRVNRPPPYTVDPSTPGSFSKLSIQSAATPEEAFQISAVTALMNRLQRDSAAVMRSGAKEMDELFNTQVALNERREQVDQGFLEMKQEKESLEQQLQLYMANTDLVESWLKENEGGNRADLGIDEMFQPEDAISRQLLECTATDLTIDDLLYSLDRAVQDGAVPWDAYYKAVRQLSREQFYQRAIGLKAAAEYRHSPYRNSAARSSEINMGSNQGLQRAQQ